MNQAARPVVCAVLSLAMAGSACKTPTGGGGAATGESITRAAQGIERGRAQLDETVAALKAMVETPAADLGPQFEAFDSSLARLEGTAADVAALATRMEERGSAYFQKWDEQIAAIQNEDIRERSEKRRSAVTKAFERLGEDYQDAREAFQPLMADLRDVRTALASDLTSGGVKSISSIAQRVGKRAGSVGKELDELAASFRELGVGLSSAGPPTDEAR